MIFSSVIYIMALTALFYNKERFLCLVKQFIIWVSNKNKRFDGLDIKSARKKYSKDFFIFCLNNKIHFFLANANNSASFKRKMFWKSQFLLIRKQKKNLWMKLPTIPPGLVGKIVKYRPLSEPIRLQDLQDSAPSQAWKKVNNINMIVF